MKAFLFMKTFNQNNAIPLSLLTMFVKQIVTLLKNKMKNDTLISPKVPLTLLTKKVMIRGPSSADGSK